MNISYIERNLENSHIIKNVLYFETISSTNDYAKEQNIPNFSLILTDHQTHGRGQRDHVWLMTNGENIAMTIYIEPNCHIDRFRDLTLQIGEKVKNAISELYSIDLRVEKPNDLLLNGKKIGGILTETVVEKNTVKKLIIGIGFNVNQQNMQNEIANIATSLKIETNKPYLREEIIVKICNKVEELFS
jgi:BirA family biotin operon repressor/biotin-[acetyl-CoA-carboxylase] ligase